MDYKSAAIRNLGFVTYCINGCTWFHLIEILNDLFPLSIIKYTQTSITFLILSLLVVYIIDGMSNFRVQEEFTSLHDKRLEHCYLLIS